MRYIIISGIALITVLLFSKLFIAINLDSMYDLFMTDKKEKALSQSELVQIGKPIYLVYCSSCHGSDGTGNQNRAQDHTKRIAKKTVLDVIKHGANNFRSIYPSGMPAGLISDKNAKEVAKYIANGMSGEAPKSWTKCATCHDKNGEGIPYIAPNIKVYSDQLVHSVLTNGKKGVIGRMPSFEGRFSDRQMQALAAYIRNLGKDNPK